MDATRSAVITRVAASGASSSSDDHVVVEEPLEIRVAGDTLAITMRTPGHDRELALGFLWAEGIIASLDDVAGVAHCARADDEGRLNTIEVTPAPGARLKLPEDSPARRGTLTTSACGVCGRRSIDDLLARCRPLDEASTMSRDAIARALEALRATQPVFARTGGCHGAALVTLDGAHVATFEDVGRHNAVDKLVGAMLLARALPLRAHALVVSGRTSFEIVQKAVAAGISIVVGISAASSLAIDVAKRAGVTLVGFARGGQLVVYAGADRLTALTEAARPPQRGSDRA
jgi:FdhD protein